MKTDEGTTLICETKTTRLPATTHTRMLKPHDTARTLYYSPTAVPQFKNNTGVKQHLNTILECQDDSVASCFRLDLCNFLLAPSCRCFVGLNGVVKGLDLWDVQPVESEEHQSLHLAG